MCYSTINVFFFVKNDLIHFERIYLYPTDSIIVSCTAMFRNECSCTCMAIAAPMIT